MNESDRNGYPPPGSAPPVMDAPAMTQPHTDATVPLMKTSLPATTISARPWSVLVTFGISMVCTIVLGLVHYLGNYSTGETTLSKLVNTLRAGDVDSLLEDPELGFRERAERDIRQRGLEEYNQILSAFNTCSSEGLEKYRQLDQNVTLLGEESFKKLPAEEQRDIRQASRQQWILSNGLAALGPEGGRGLDDAAALWDEEAEARFVIPLGHASVAAKQVEKDLPDLDTVKSWDGKASGAQKALLERIQAEGQTAIDEVRKESSTAGQKLFKNLSPAERKGIAGASYRRWIVDKGIDALEEEDRALVTGPEMFLDDADADMEARRLCTLILPPHRRALIEGRDYESFTAKREDYIRTTGRERYVKFLAVLFSSCEYRIIESEFSGNDPLDLFRVSKAQFSVQWTGCPGAAEYLGENITFSREGKSWRLDQPLPVTSEGPAPPEKLLTPAEGGDPASSSTTSAPAAVPVAMPAGKQDNGAGT